MTTQINIDELEQLAKAATPGAWVAKDSPGAGLEIYADVPSQLHMDPRMWPAFSTANADCKEKLVAYETWIQFPSEKLNNVQARNAVFIAAANPATVLSLIDRLRKAEQERDWATKRTHVLERDFQESRGMADCMQMLRQDMIDAGVLDASVPPMMMSEAIIPKLKERDALAAKLNELEAKAERYRVLLSNVDHTQPVNARLLEALREVVADAEAFERRTGGKISGWLDKARAAIAAAESQQAEPVRLTDEVMDDVLNWIRNKHLGTPIPMHQLARKIEAEILRANGFKVEG